MYYDDDDDTNTGTGVSKPEVRTYSFAHIYYVITTYYYYCIKGDPTINVLYSIFRKVSTFLKINRSRIFFWSRYFKGVLS